MLVCGPSSSTRKPIRFRTPSSQPVGEAEVVQEGWAEHGCIDKLAPRSVTSALAEVRIPTCTKILSSAKQHSYSVAHRQLAKEGKAKPSTNSSRAPTPGSLKLLQTSVLKQARNQYMAADTRSNTMSTACHKPGRARGNNHSPSRAASKSEGSTRGSD